MHETSYLKAKAFYETYIKVACDVSDKAIRILDIGSKSYSDHLSYRTIFAHKNIDYVGLDLEAGLNIDIVPEDTYL
jgi:SAM-dependent methyltransferase